MIKFFRKIRQKLLAENRFRKYLIYAVGEIILVVIGILIALQINNWNEDRKTNIEEKRVLALLKDNLRTELAELNFYTEEMCDHGINYLTSIYNKDYHRIVLDSFPLSATRFFNYKSVNTTYQGLKSSGRLSIIKNEILREKATFYYESRFQLMKDWADWHKNFVTNKFESYVIDELPVTPDELIIDLDFLKEKLETRKLKSLIANQIGSLKRIKKEINDNKVYANELVDLIDKELSND